MAPDRESPGDEARADLADVAARAASGDHDAFRTLHDRFDPGLRRLLGRRTQDRTLIDEVCQRTWAAAWEACRAGRYDATRSAFSTFLYAIAHHMWLRHLRAAGRAPGQLADQATTGADTDALHLAGAVECVREALDGRAGDLTEQERWVLRLAGEGGTDRTIAERLGVSPSTAHQARKSALRKLERLLARRGFREDPGERTGDAGEEP